MKLKWMGGYQLLLSNKFCSIEFYSERYYDSLVLILIDNSNGNRYPYPKIVEAKKALDSSNDEKNCKSFLDKVIFRILFINNFLEKELDGVFSELEDLS